MNYKEPTPNYSAISMHLDNDNYVRVYSRHISRKKVEYTQNILAELRKEGLLTRTTEKTDKSMRKTRFKIKQLLELNLNYTSRFVTLTFKENMQDYKKAMTLFNTMISNFNKKHKDNKLQYLVVKEHQARGAIHYHMITFNHLRIKWSEWWKHGATHQKYINERNPQKIANYFTKYLTKQKDTHKQIAVGFRILAYSQNLIKPVIYRFKDEEDMLHELKTLTILKWVKTHPNGSHDIDAIISRKEFDEKDYTPF